MLRVFQNDLLNTKNFIITLELVPGKESTGRSVDTVMGIAQDSFSDGRISAGTGVRTLMEGVLAAAIGSPSGPPRVQVANPLLSQRNSLRPELTPHSTDRDGMGKNGLKPRLIGSRRFVPEVGLFRGIRKRR